MDKIKNQLQISVSNGFVDEGDGVVSFPGGLTITDDSVMRSGTSYDVATLDISKYPGQLTADHEDSLGTLIGKTIGVMKEGTRVSVQGIKYAVTQNPYARLAYDLLVGGFSNSFSVETCGPWPDQQDPVYRNHELVGLSQVVVPNNYNAHTNQFNEIVHNSLERSQQDGLDTTGIEQKFLSQVTLVKSETVKEESMTKEEKEKLAVEEAAKIKAEQAAAEKTKQDAVEAEAKAEEARVAAEKEAAEKEAEEKLEAENAAKKEAEEKEAVENAAKEAEVAKQAAEAKEQEEAEAKAKADEEAKNALKEKELNKNKENLEMTKEEMTELIANSVAAALKPVQDELATVKETAQNAFDAQAKEPEFKKVEEEVKNSYEGLTGEELFTKQLNAAVAAERMQSVEARKTLNDINALNLQALKDQKVVNAAVTLEDLGNFVISPELYNQVATMRTDFSKLIDATQWRETSSIEFGWLTRSEDIDMQSVAMGVFEDAGSNANARLKPVSTPAYGAHTDKLEELAAVTPISINIIKFAAADILADVAEGYRTDYDRKRAQLVVARLQQAVDATGNKFTFDMSEGLIGWTKVTSYLSDFTSVGTLVMSNKSLTELKGEALKNYNAASLLAEINTGSIMGIPFITVPNSLLPTINTTETKTFKVYGADVTIDQAVFYAYLPTFTGRSSGGLKYDVDGSASYEIGGTVYSAYQRNEIVLRGSFFRGGVVKDTQLVASIPASAIS